MLTTILKHQKIFVLGLGVSGISTARFISKLGAKTYIFDDNKTLEQIAKLNLDKNIEFCHYDKINWDEIDYLVLSPGIPSSLPEPHPAVVQARSHSVKITVDVELFVNLIPNSNIIAITGTNGKSTVASLIYHILSSCNKKVCLGGNIGVPVFDLEINNDNEQYYVLELSSYQLELIDLAAFDIAILLNITADHLDRHGNMANYVKAKENIIKNTKQNQRFIISIDDDYCDNIYQNYNGESLTISNNNNKADVFFDQQKEIINYYTEKILFPIDVKRFGNKQNILAAVTTAKLYHIANNHIIEAIKTFKPLPYRMEFLGKIRNINFYNDSKATNAESSLNAIKQLQNIYWIAGGIAKSGGINIIKDYLHNIRKIFLIGQSQEYFATQLAKYNFHSYSSFPTLELAVGNAILTADKEQQEINILFSPAAASFDKIGRAHV